MPFCFIDGVTAAVFTDSNAFLQSTQANTSGMLYSNVSLSAGLMYIDGI